LLRPCTSADSEPPPDEPYECQMVSLPVSGAAVGLVVAAWLGVVLAAVLGAVVAPLPHAEATNTAPAARTASRLNCVIGSCLSSCGRALTGPAVAVGLPERPALVAGPSPAAGSGTPREARRSRSRAPFDITPAAPPPAERAALARSSPG